MTGTLRWHSCSTTDFPLKRHKVSKACETCRGKKMRCDGNNPCQRCDSNKMICTYNDKPARSRSISVLQKPSSSSSNSSLTLSPPQPSITPKDEIPILCLNKITFVNELYESIKLQQWPKTRRYGTSLPPLLFDFFHTTSQPPSIWSYFTLTLNKIYQEDNVYFLRDANEEDASQLAKDAIQVFFTYNLLYSSFLDTTLLLFVLSSVSLFPYMQQSLKTITTKELPFHESYLPYYSMLIYCILALTFQSAYQLNLNDPISNSLYTYSHLFYREAHKIWTDFCFPTEPFNPTESPLPQRKKHVVLLVQASILLTHFQSVAISEEQAYMTLSLGVNLSRQISLSDIEEEEKETIVSLLKSLDAWHVWLSFYLQKPYIETTVHDIVFTRKTKEQRWAIYVTDTYTFFLKNLLKKKKSAQPININTIKDILKSIVTNEIEQDYFPNQIIQLYHNILTIQLYTSQLENNVFNLSEPIDANDTLMDILYICISHSQTILSKVTKCIFSDPKHIPVALVYSTCLISQLNLYLTKHKKSFPSLQKEYDSLQSNLLELLKSTSFDSFQILYSKFVTTPSKRIDTTKPSTISPSPTSLSTSSSTTTHTSNPLQSAVTDVVLNPTIATETQTFLSVQTTNNEVLMGDPHHLSMNLPMTGGITSRADIDREQLNKLSHHYPHQTQLQLQQQQMLLQKQQLNQFEFQQPSYCVSKYMQPKRLNDQYYYYKNGQKRAYQQIYNQFDYNNLNQPTIKRQRSTTSIPYDVYSNKSQENIVVETPHERSKSVATEFIDLETNNENFMYDMWMLDNNSTEDMYDVRLKPYNNFLPPDNKLPLPQPSKQTSMVSKTWLTSQAQTSSKIFFDSEVQTLHYQTPPLVHFEPTAFPLVVMDEEQNDMYSRPTIESSTQWSFSKKNFSRQNEENVHWINSEKVGEEEYWVE